MNALISALNVILFCQIGQTQTYPGFDDVILGSGNQFDARLLGAKKDAIVFIESLKTNPRSNYLKDPEVKKQLDADISALKIAKIVRVTADHTPKTGCRVSVNPQGQEVVPVFYTPRRDAIVACIAAADLVYGELVQNIAHEASHLGERTLSPTGDAESFVDSETMAVELEYAAIRNNNFVVIDGKKYGCVFHISDYKTYPNIKKALIEDKVVTPRLCDQGLEQDSGVRVHF